MQISITNGTLTSIQETLSPSSNYNLPNSITVTGASSSYSSSTGNVTLTSLTSTIIIIAAGEIIKTYYDLSQLFLAVGNRNIEVKATAPTVSDSNFSNQETYPLVYTITGTATNCTINNESSCAKGAINNGTAIIPVEADGTQYYVPFNIIVEGNVIEVNTNWSTITNKCQVKYVTESETTGIIQFKDIIDNITFSLSGIPPYDGIILKPTSLDTKMTSLGFTTF